MTRTSERVHNMLDRPVNRRRLLVGGVAAVASAAIDTLGGLKEAGEKLSDKPRATIYPNSDKDRVILTFDGFGGNSQYMTEAMLYRLQPFGTIIAVNYAETNMDAEPIKTLVHDTLSSHDLLDRPRGAYLRSAAGIFNAEPLRLLKDNHGISFDTIVFDGSPSSIEDVPEPQRTMLNLHPLRYSRLVNAFSTSIANNGLPSASQRSPNSPLAAVEAYRETLLEVDSVTLGAQAECMVDWRPEPGMLADVARKFRFIDPPDGDPFIDSSSAIEGWRQICGDLGVITDNSRTLYPRSHAAGPLYPTGVASEFYGMKPPI